MSFKSLLLLLLFKFWKMKAAEICMLKRALNYYFLHCPDMNPAKICIFKWPLNNYNFICSPWNVKLASDCVFSSVSSSQWQHEQPGGALVLLRGPGAGGHDPRTDLLPEEILWSAESRIKTLNINTLSPWFTSFSNWTSDSTEIRRTWLFASPSVILFLFAPVVDLFIVCFGKGCKFG